jgi:predicted transcriptional regulator
MPNSNAEPRLTFERFHALTMPLVGPERLELFLMLADDVRDAAWDELARRIDRERWSR